MTKTSAKAVETEGKGKLSIRRQRFAEMMLVCSSATKAAIAAGYSEKSAHVTGCRLLKDANVLVEISRLQKLAAEKADIKPEYVIYGIQHDIDGARESKNWTAAMKGWDMLGRRLGMWKDSLEIKPLDDSDHRQNFAVLALAGAGGDRVLARRILHRLLREIGTEEVFGPPISGQDIDALLDGATQH